MEEERYESMGVGSLPTGKLSALTGPGWRWVPALARKGKIFVKNGEGEILSKRCGMMEEE